MNFLKALFGKAESTVEPKTLDQARHMFAELKANAERIEALFTEAGLDVAALLAKGKTALRDHIVQLARLPENAKLDLAVAQGLTDEAIANLRQAATRAETIIGAFAVQLGLTPQALATASQEDIRTAFNNLVAVRATEKLGELGFPESKLPATASAGGSGVPARLTGMARVRAAIENMPGGSGGRN